MKLFGRIETLHGELEGKEHKPGEWNAGSYLMSKEKQQWPEFLWVPFPSMLMGIVDVKLLSVLHPHSPFRHHPKSKLQNMNKSLGKNNFYRLLKHLHFDLQAIL